MKWPPCSGTAGRLPPDHMAGITGIRMGKAYFGFTVFDALQLQKDLIGMAVRPTAEFTAIIAEDGRDCGLILLEEGKYFGTEHMHRCHRKLGSVEPAPGVAPVNVLYTPVFQRCHDTKPEFSPSVCSIQRAKHLLDPLRIHAQGQVDRLVFHGSFIADLDLQGI